METTRGPIGLLIPVINNDLVNDSLFSLSDIQTWVGELSIENSGISAKLLLDRLHATQCCHVTPLIRLAMLEALTPSIESVTLLLEEKYLKGVNLSPDVRRKIGTAAESIEIELLTGYKTIIEQLSSNIREHKNPLLFSLHRFFTISQTILFRSQQFYSKPPAGLWKECHLVYCFCEINRLLNKHIDDPNYLKKSNKYSTVLEAYLHSIVFSLSDPHRLNSIEMSQLNLAISNWIMHTKLVPYDKDIHYAIDLANDAPPINHLYLDKAALPEECRSVVLDDLIESLSGSLTRINTQSNVKFTAQGVSHELGISKTTLTKLLHNWKESLDRSAQRVETTGECTIFSGLNTIFQALTIKDPESSLQSFHCSLVNKSNGGVCIKWSVEIPAEFESGSLIAISSPTLTNNKIWLGTVQWIKKSEDSWQMGLHFISQITTPVRVRLMSEQNQPLSDVMIGLLLDPYNEVPHKTFVTGLMPFKPGSIVQVEDATPVYTINLGTILLKTNSIVRFNIEGLL